MKNKQKLKILVDCHKFDEDLQGITTYLEGLYKELIKQEEITFFLATNNLVNLEKVFGTAKNIKYVQLKFKNKWLRLLIDFPIIILKNKIDFAHFQYVVPPIKFCKYITTIHDVLFLDYPSFFSKKYIIKNKLLFKFSAYLSDVVLTVSNYSKERLIENFNLHKTIFVTPNAVNEVYFQDYDKEKTRISITRKFKISREYFILVSRIEPRKNHLLLLKTYIENKYFNDFDLVFVGKKDLDYEDLDLYLKNVDNFVNESIYFLDKVDNLELLDLVRGASLSIYPSFAEGFGIPPLETLAAKVPTVCSNKTAMRDFSFLKEYQFNPNNPTELKEKIDQALAEYDFVNSIKELKSAYNWQKSSNNYLEAIRFKTSN